MHIKDLELENLLELLKRYELTELTIQEGRQTVTLKRNVTQHPYMSQSLPGIDSISPSPVLTANPAPPLEPHEAVADPEVPNP
ncbi:MAG: hypothetical protein JXI33_06710, partial [Candidatus Aminicenantes bacterium]|nr:hypothetical protein [Candidatus Aminicenantes bacterium]